MWARTAAAGWEHQLRRGSGRSTQPLAKALGIGGECVKGGGCSEGKMEEVPRAVGLLLLLVCPSEVERRQLYVANRRRFAT